MKTKTIVTFALLAFVAWSFSVAVGKVMRTPQSGAVEESTTEDREGKQDQPFESIESGFVAIYFHAPHRCPTCRKIEEYAHEALASEIEGRQLIWKTADYTRDESRPIVEQFRVFTSTVVLVEVRDGQPVRWKNLEEVWLHTGDQSKFLDFVKNSWVEFQAATS